MVGFGGGTMKGRVGDGLEEWFGWLGKTSYGREELGNRGEGLWGIKKKRK